MQLSPGVNFIFGENGSGKTSVLEAISVLALGRSFRTHKHKPLIKNDESSFTVFGKVLSEDQTEIPMGILRRSDGGVHFKVNGNMVSSIASLASVLPIQFINSDTFMLLEGPPKVRRQFIDWLVFHVEPNFFQVWKDCQRCLKHRNSLLRRDRIDKFELSSWDKELVMHSEKLDLYRSNCLDYFQVAFRDLLSEFISIGELGLSYYSGWGKEIGYADILESSFDRDRHLGFTQFGSHKADLKITVNKQNAAEVLSRGQQKLIVCALKIAQGYVFTERTGRKAVYLIDDLPSELDQHNRGLLSSWLDKMSTQVIVTGVEGRVLVDSWLQSNPAVDKKMFHVEHGAVKEIPLNKII